MEINKGDYGWWIDGNAYQIVTKRRKVLTDGKRYRVVELKLVYSPPPKEKVLTTQDWSWISRKDVLLVPIGIFKKNFIIDNTVGLLFEKEN